MNTRQDYVNNYCFVCHTTLEECYCYDEFDYMCNNCNLPFGECDCYADYCQICGELPSRCDCDEVDNNKY